MDIPQMLVAYCIATYEEVIVMGWLNFIVGLFIGVIGGMVIMGLCMMASDKPPRKREDGQIDF